MSTDNFIRAQRWTFILVSVLIIFWILAIFGVIPETPEFRSIFIVAGWTTIISFWISPVLLIVRHFLVKKNIALTTLSVVTLLSSVPFFIQHKTHESKICTCCDEYLIPEDTMDHILIGVVTLSLICYIFSGYVAFKKELK